MPSRVDLYDELVPILDTTRTGIRYHSLEKGRRIIIRALSGCENRHHPVSSDDHMAEWVDTVRIRALACILEFDLKR